MVENVVGVEAVGGDVAGHDAVARAAAAVTETMVHFVFGDGDMTTEICPDGSPRGVEGLASSHPTVLGVFQADDVVRTGVEVFDRKVFDVGLLDGIDDENTRVELARVGQAERHIPRNRIVFGGRQFRRFGREIASPKAYPSAGRSA